MISLPKLCLTYQDHDGIKEHRQRTDPRSQRNYREQIRVLFNSPQKTLRNLLSLWPIKMYFFTISLTLFGAALFLTESDARYSGPTNAAGLRLIKHWEGFFPNFYTDPVGIKTIGYGHACHVNDCSVPLNGKYNVPLTQQTGEDLLKDDLVPHESCVNSRVTYAELNANQFSALVSFSFNVGCGSLRRSTLLVLLNRGDVIGASNEFGKWVHAGGKVLPGLVKRRAAEKDLFCSDGVC